MEFDLSKSVEILTRTPQVLTALLQGVSKEWIISNEGINTWSPYDIIGHYIEGEKTDWIPRMNIILSEDNNKRFVPFNRFAQLDKKPVTIEALLAEFSQLRKENVAGLKKAGLTEEKLNRKGIHPELGEVTLKQLLATWVVHDLNHIYQVSRVMAKQYRDEVGPWTKYLSILNR
ncbi:MAG TPA: DinB family protein [Flavisolibacter sp.]|nr:DinB family protein [Flavisolibacter sp.]